MASAPRVLLHNWHLKLAALGLAVLLWALVQTEPLSQETFAAVPVTVEVLDSSWTTAGLPSPATVDLRLGGPAREIIRLARDGTTLRVPVTAVGSRDTIIALQREWVDLGQRSGVTVESVSPLTIEIAFEPATTRSVRVWIPTRGSLPEDLALSSELAISPTTVDVRGPEGRVMGLDSVPLVPMDLAAVRESGAFTVQVDTSELGGATVRPASVLVGVRVESVVERTLEAVQIHADAPAGEPPAAVMPSTIQLRLVGASTLVTAMDLSLVRVSVPPGSLSGLAEGETRRVRLTVEGVPPLVVATPETDVVTARRAGPQPSGGGGL
jgi:YbbR domain-containing protein